MERGHSLSFFHLFQREHPAVVAVGSEDLVEVVEGFELFVDRAMPVAEVKAGGKALIVL